MLLVAAPLLTNANAQQTGYVTEFSELGEQPVVDSVWAYLTGSGSLDTVDLFRYGTTLVAFDSTTNQPLSGNQSLDFLTSYELSALTASGVLTESSFTISFQLSAVCEVAVPQLGNQLQGLAADKASSALEKVLPDGAASVVQGLFNLGDEVGLVKEADPAMLALGVSCYGGNLMESYAATQLTSCQEYVANLKNHVVYQGMSSDLVNCIPSAINKLQLAQYSPDVLIQYGETVVSNAATSAGNTIQGGFCYLLHCQVPPPHFNNATLDQILGEINDLSSITPSLQGAKSAGQTDSQNMAGRLYAKANEAQVAIANLSSKIGAANAAIGRHSGLAQVASYFESPSFDTSQAVSDLNTASSLLQTAQAYAGQYRYNSATNAANRGFAFANSSLSDVQAQEGVVRGPSIVADAILATLAVVLVGSVLSIRSGNSSQRRGGYSSRYR